jgi:hypothetical protein
MTRNNLLATLKISSGYIGESSPPTIRICLCISEIGKLKVVLYRVSRLLANSS